MFTAQERGGLNPNVITRTKTWADPFKWNRVATLNDTREMVFTCSWSDWFHEAADAWRPEAWQVVKKADMLDFQILTKRPGNIPARLPADWGQGYPNVWLGVSVENDKFTWRLDELRKVPAAIRFLSIEPLLGPLPKLNLTGIDWVIVGGESGPGYRPMPHEWVHPIYEQCKAEGIAFFFKQSAMPRTEMGIELQGVGIHREYPTPRRVQPTASGLF